MKRFHVHAYVQSIPASVEFYTKMFASEPTRLESDYAKWMLDDPRVNFAISTRGSGRVGVDHLGMQTDDENELEALKAQAREAGLTVADEGETGCCYARSEKHWLVDPQGIPWEHFHTLGDIPTFSGSPARGPSASACCDSSSKETGKASVLASSAFAPTASACCGPSSVKAADSAAKDKSATACC